MSQAFNPVNVSAAARIAELERELADLKADRHARTPEAFSDLSPMHRRVLDSMTEGVSVATAAGIIVYTNPAEDRMFGYEPGELVGQHVTVQNAYPAAENERRVSEVIAKLQADGAWIGEWHNRQKDGTPFYTRARITALDLDGKTHWVCVQEDITKRRGLETEIRYLLDTTPAFIARLDRHARYVQANRAYEEWTGLSVDQIRGRQVADLFGEEYFARIRPFVERALAGEQVSFDSQLPDLQGKLHTLRVSYTPERDEQDPGSICGYTVLVYDITEQKRAEAAREEVERQLLLLLEASGSLLASPNSLQVLRTIVELASRFVSADGYAVWRRAETGVWRLASSAGLSDEFIQTGLGGTVEASNAAPLSAPMMFADVAQHPRLEHRREALQHEGVHSMLAVPLTIHGQSSGTVVFYWRTKREVTDTEISIASALGNLAAAALGTAELYDRERELRAQAEQAERRAAFLAEAGIALASSFDSDANLTNVTRLAVPAFADWCAVDLIDPENGHTRRVAVTHQDPEKIDLVRQLHRRYPARENDPERVALREGRSILIADIPDERLTARAHNDEHARMLRRLGLKSCLIVPIRSDGRTTGMISFATAESQRSYDPADLQMAEDLARRAASAIALHRLYREVHDSEERFRQLAEHIRKVFYICDPDGLRIHYVSPGYAEVWGRSVESLYADPRSFVEGVHPDDRGRVLAALAQQRAGETADAEYRVIRPDGSVRWVWNRSFPVRNQEGVVYRYAGIAEDVTERKRLLREAQQARELAEKSNIELRRANIDLEQFAYSASHDLKEPLRTVAIYSTMLQRRFQGRLDAEADECLRFIHQGARRMDTLVADLLAYTQAGSGPDEPVAPLDSLPVLQSALDNLKGAISESGAVVHVSAETPFPALRLQRIHLLQLFQNLIGNAIKYRGPQTPEIAVSVTADERGFWRFSVADNGLGIAPVYAEQVFGLFKRLHRQDQYSGTGIGLAICQKIVHRYGGRIWVESTGADAGAGSTFYFTLPG